MVNASELLLRSKKMNDWITGDRPMYYILDENKEPVPCTMWEFIEWRGEWKDDSKIRVDATTVGKNWISTVFLMGDHNFIGIGRPILFETMIFNEELEEWEGYQRRYCTWDEAVAGHQETVKMVQAGDQNVCENCQCGGN